MTLLAIVKGVLVFDDYVPGVSAILEDFHQLRPLDNSHSRQPVPPPSLAEDALPRKLLDEYLSVLGVDVVYAVNEFPGRLKVIDEKPDKVRRVV